VIVDPGRLALFLAASAALILTPGPAVLFIVARSLSLGRRAGLVSVLGIGAGNAVHAGAGVLGLAALLASSKVAFAAVRYAGAAYLVFLGVASLLRRPVPEGQGAAGDAPPAALGPVFRQAFAVAVLNPKTALFFLAFLPQFVDPARGAARAQMMLLGGLFLGLAVLSDGAYALLAGTVGGWLRRHPAVAGRGRWLGAAVYLGLGALAALAPA
jgi:threonine/homoserine/homoserine lactone efflux protein